MRRLRHLMRKELLELRQDPKLFGILFVAPLIQLTFLGYAATTDVKNVPVVVADADRSAASRELVERFDGVAVLHDRRHRDERERGRPVARARHARGSRSGSRPGTTSASAPADPAAVQVIADGTDANSTNVALGYAQSLVAGYSQELAARQRGLAAVPPPRHRGARARVVQPAASRAACS